jgi:WD40 repeat protein
MIGRLTFLLSLLLPAAAQAQPRTDTYGDPLPMNALARFGSTRPQHVWPIQAVAFAPDNRTLASCDGSSVRLWDLASGKQLQLHRDEHLEELSELTFSADGKWLAVGGNRWVTIYDVAAGKFHRRLDHGKAEIHRLCFTLDSRTLLTSDSATPRQWDPKTDGLIRAFPSAQGYENHINAIAASPDSKNLVLFESDGRVSWHSLENGKKLKEWTLERHGSRAIFSPDGKWLVYSPGYNEHLICIELATGKAVRTFPPGNSTRRPGFSADSQYLVTTEDGFCFWKVNTGGKAFEVPREYACWANIAVAHDGKSLAYSASCQLFVVETATGKVIRTIGKEPDRIDSVAFLPDGKSAAVVTEYGACELWDLATGASRGKRLTLPRQLSIQGPMLASSDREGRLLLWDLATGKQLHALATGGDPRRLCLSADGTRIAARCYHHGPTIRSRRVSLRVWRLDTGNEVRTLDVSDLGMYSFTFTPDGESVALMCDQNLTDRHTQIDLVFWDLKKGALRRQRLDGLRAASEIALSPDGRLLAVGARGFNCLEYHLGIFVYEVATGRRLWTTPGQLNNSRDHLLFSRDGQTLMAVQGEHVQFWDASSGQPRGRLTGHEGGVTSLALSPDGRTLLTSGAETTVLHWDVSALLKPSWKPSLLSRSELQECWAALGQDEAVLAYRSLARLRATPPQAVELLQERLRPIPLPDRAAVARYLTALEDSKYTVRQQALAALEQFGRVIVPVLEEKLQDAPPLESRRRLEALSEKLSELPITTEELRGLRAVAVLEGTDESAARQVLEKLAAGAPGALLTREAQAALRRSCP